MRLTISKSKNAQSFYVIEDCVINGKRTSKIIEKLGTFEELSKKLNGEDPVKWAKEYIKNINIKEKEENQDIIVKFSQSKKIKLDVQNSFNGGYLFLQKIFYDLKLNNICKKISDKYNFSYDLESVLSRLVYARILYPTSKLSTFKLSKKFIESPNFELHHIYRSLEILEKEMDFIQSELYKNSLDISKRNTDILYYDCTNFFFEINQEQGIKQYGVSKENRPNPIVQMGFFMDGSGIPLAFNLNQGNTNEQKTLKPLERQIIKDFELSKFVVCTDAGLSSNDNRKYNSIQNRAFVTTQSIKKLKSHLKEWALDDKNWICKGKKYNLKEINDDEHFNDIFYKERWITENGLEQRLIVTYSPKYAIYQKNIREKQVTRAEKLINSSTNLNRKKQNDAKRFIQETAVTDDGEIATKNIYEIDENTIKTEEMYDGFYAVCTNLEWDINQILKINKNRWEIEESFRILKSEFKARPVYLQKDNRIIAHFIVCFISILIFRLLEKKLDENFTSSKIIGTLKEFNFQKIYGKGYVPLYTRTELTDKLHKVFAFNTDFEIVATNKMKKIIKNLKKIKN